MLQLLAYKKGKQKEIIKDNNLKPGVKITKNLITTTKNYIKKKYREDGFFNTEVEITTKPFIDSLGVEFSKHLTVNINRNKKVKISSIEIKGNEELSDSKLKGLYERYKREIVFSYLEKVKIHK